MTPGENKEFQIFYAKLKIKSKISEIEGFPTEEGFMLLFTMEV